MILLIWNSKKGKTVGAEIRSVYLGPGMEEGALLQRGVLFGNDANTLYKIVVMVTQLYTCVKLIKLYT